MPRSVLLAVVFSALTPGRLSPAQAEAKGEESPRSAEALLRAARSAPLAPDGRERALAALRRLQEEYPDRSQDPEVLEEIERQGEWRFSAVANHCVIDGSGRVLQPAWGWLSVVNQSARSTLAIHQVMPELYQKALEASPAGTLPLPRPETWTGSEVVLEGSPEATERHSFSAAGFHIVEERIEGLRRFHLLNVCTFGVIFRALCGRAVAYAFDPQDGEPLEGVQIKVKTRDRSVEGRTDRQGLFFFGCPSTATAVVSKGSEVQVYIVESPPSEKDRLVFITTDRRLYVPGQEVRWKAVLRERRGSSFSLPAERKVRVDLRDPSGGVVEERECPVNDFGSTSGSFVLGPGAVSGTYQVVVQVPGRPWRAGGRSIAEGDLPFWSQEFRVAQHQKPGIELLVEIHEDPPGPFRDARARIRALDPSGSPAPDAEVTWNAVARCIPLPTATGRGKAVFPGAQGKPFEDWAAWRTRQDTTRDKAGESLEDLGGGVERTAAQGSLEVSFPLPAGDPFREIRVRAVARDAAGLPVEAQSCRETWPQVHRIALWTERLFYQAGERFAVRARVTGLDGRPASGVRVELRGWRGESEWASPEEELLSKSATTDERGLVEVGVQSDVGGKINFAAGVATALGQTAKDRIDLWIYGGAGAPLPEWSGAVFDVAGVLSDQASYNEGQQARLLLESEFAGPALLLLEGEDLLKARAIHRRTRSDIVPISLPRGADPVVRVLTFRPGPLDMNSSWRRIPVYPRGRFLRVEAVPERTSYRAGEAARVQLGTELEGKPVSAEVELSVVEERCGAFPVEEKADIGEFFDYPWEPWSATSGWVQESYRGLDLIGPWFRAEEIRARELFRGDEDLLEEDPLPRPPPETLFWSPHVRTGPDGKAEVEVGAPRHPGRWRILARAIAGASSFGRASATFLSVSG